MNYWIIFLTGLTTGGVTCAAMQGGILAGIIASGAKVGSNTSSSLRSDSYSIAAFLLSKLLSHFLLGALLGLVGSQAELGEGTRLIFQGFAALFMLVAALNLLDVHPLLRYLVITPPRALLRFAKGSSRLTPLLSPAVFGALTILIPCGVTQAMEVVAVASGSPLSGALILATFVAGTIPSFALIGLAASRLSRAGSRLLAQVAATLLIVLSLSSFNGILTALDSPYSLERVWQVLSTPVGATRPVAVANGVQKVTLSVENSGYSPRAFTVARDIPVELTLAAGKVYTCALSFTLPAFGIRTTLPPSSSQTLTFTPRNPGRYTYTCSMGMYSGVMEVI